MPHDGKVAEVAPPANYIELEAAYDIAGRTWLLADPILSILGLCHRAYRNWKDFDKWYESVRASAKAELRAMYGARVKESRETERKEMLEQLQVVKLQREINESAARTESYQSSNMSSRVSAWTEYTKAFKRFYGEEPSKGSLRDFGLPYSL